MDINQKKEELRRQLLEQRKSIAAPAFYGASADIIEELKEQKEFRDAGTIHSYVSMNERREVETRVLIKEMIARGRDVVVPVTDFQSRTLTHLLLKSFSDLKENRWGVMEPAKGEEVAPEEIDLVIVPMVGGDEQCNRIGYGEGFYDRFLKDVRCPKIGLSFDCTIVEQLPTEHYDISLDKIITEKRILTTE
ncbi:5-formyltetrahydrofolate cyclo-ligase [Fodinibius sp.]|uniref:5-formyltetrahydrofolate cyclo-ligase n=1 Tax=Fodinibius sp. TaxID=1872440 RepID=UPI002ACD442E|nr:5-formyltetrahydrofolate cyclo-ligase [Fodinibius sp.]MDZ7659226.1 5-formyltetrahydrofolate cyclo-ligase [Fodinibius sp.]